MDRVLRLVRSAMPAIFAGVCALTIPAQGEPSPSFSLSPIKPYGVLPNIALPPEGGFAVPEYGTNTDINRVYLAPDNHLVIAFSYRDKGVLMSDMYDTTSKQRIFPDKAYQAARDNEVEFGYVRTHGLRQLGPLMGVKTPSGWQVWSGYVGGRICPNNPYFNEITINRNNMAAVEFSLFKKRPRPAKVRLAPDCGVESATYRYEDVYPNFYSSDAGFLMETGRFLIWFNWNGTSPFLNGRNDFVAVPLKAIRPVLNQDREDGFAASSRNIRKADDLIDSYAHEQMKRTPHG
jgi:hypothetical protein